MDSDTREYEAASFATVQGFAASALFERTFDESMALVEECARYLDGKGRDDSKALPRKAALVYAGESMRVTTRLMQAASWLLIQRAVQEGDMTQEDAASERYRLGAREICLGRRDDGMDMMPPRLLDLLEKSESLYRRVARFDDLLFQERETRSGVQTHFAALRAAFGGGHE